MPQISLFGLSTLMSNCAKPLFEKYVTASKVSEDNDDYIVSDIYCLAFVLVCSIMELSLRGL